MKRFLSVLLWSVISAAFIGPGTVTTAASAGAGYGYRLLWALVFSTVACLVLQEASARVTLASGRSLGECLKEQYSGLPRVFVTGLVLGAVLLGCAAYEAGNLLGSVAGASLKLALSRRLLTLCIGALAGLLLYFGKTRTVARILGAVVAVMGIAFLATALLMRPNLSSLLRGAFLPSVPAGGSLLVIGLIGTTVVPYNLFLGSGVAQESNKHEYRFGLTVAVLLGGIISMGVLVVGTSVAGTFSFQALSDSLTDRLGSWAAFLFSLGLFAAGFSSAVTAPLAAALTAGSLLGGAGNSRWRVRSWRYRSVWAMVLLSGMVFGMLDVKPVPAIILAQALNGILLPLVAVLLLFIVNDRNGPAASALNRPWNNVLMVLVVGVTVVLGFSNLVRAAGMGGTAEPRWVLLLTGALTAGILVPTIRRVCTLRKLD